MNDNDVILQYLESIERKIDVLSPRINEVERWQSNANGKITVFGMVGVFLGGFLSWIVDATRH